jgi:hypothetical protein
VLLQAVCAFGGRHHEQHTSALQCSGCCLPVAVGGLLDVSGPGRDTVGVTHDQPCPGTG